MAIGDILIFACVGDAAMEVSIFSKSPVQSDVLYELSRYMAPIIYMFTVFSVLPLKFLPM
jgi:hypothetical protein